MILMCEKLCEVLTNPDIQVRYVPPHLRGREGQSNGGGKDYISICLFLFLLDFLFVVLGQ